MWRKIKKVFSPKNNIVVYTAIFGDYEDLKDPSYRIKNVDFVCFTDNKNLVSSVFDIRLVRPAYSDPVRSAKIFKILPHKYFPTYEYSMWIDGSTVIELKDIKKFIMNHLNKDAIAFMKNPERDCIYDELDACIIQKKDDPEVMRKQVARYKKEGYPRHNGLISGGIILRRHMVPEIIQLDTAWWKEIENGSRRDQLSFNYVAWKQNLRYGIIEGNLWKNDYFTVRGHKHD